jgi:hypothetical protein
MGRRDTERVKHVGRVIGHGLDRGRPLGHCRPSRPAIVERGQAVAVGEPVELKLPRLDRVAETPDQQDIWSFADLFDPDVEPTRADVSPIFGWPSFEPASGSDACTRAYAPAPAADKG